MKWQSPIIARRELEKLPICRRIEIERRFCSAEDFWETNLRREHPAHEPDKAFHNPALCAVATPSLPASRGLYSSRAIGASWPGLPATSPSLDAASSPVGRSNSLGCPSRTVTVMGIVRKYVFTLTQPSQQCFIFGLAFSGGVPRKSSEMNRKFGAENCPQTGRRQQTSKPFDQIPHVCRQRFGNFYQRIHRGRFFSAFDAADKNCRKVGLFSQLFLGEIGFFASGANAFPQQTAMWLAGRHDAVRDVKSGKITMSLTTILCLPPFKCGFKIRRRLSSVNGQ